MATKATASRLLACVGTSAMLLLVACSDGTPSANADQDAETEEAVHDHDGDAHTHDERNASGDAGDDSSETAAGFGNRIAALLAKGEAAMVFEHVEGVGLPDGWQAMLGPMLADMNGRDLETTIGAVGDFTRAELNWPEGELPEAFGEVEQILAVSYEQTDPDGDSESGRFTFPLVQRDDGWKILLVGPGG